MKTIEYYFSHDNCPFQRTESTFSDPLRAKLICAETLWRQDVTLGPRRSYAPEKGEFSKAFWHFVVHEDEVISIVSVWLCTCIIISLPDCHDLGLSGGLQRGLPRTSSSLPPGTIWQATAPLHQWLDAPVSRGKKAGLPSGLAPSHT